MSKAYTLFVSATFTNLPVGSTTTQHKLGPVHPVANGEPRTGVRTPVVLIEKAAQAE